MSGLLDHLWSRRQAATVPSMDGVLRPNDALDQARALAAAPAPDNLVALGADLVFSSGADLFRLSGATSDSAPVLFQRLEGPVTALAASPGGALAAGIDGVGVRIVGGPHDGAVMGTLGGRAALCVTAAAFGDEHLLYVCLGSSNNGALDWQRDLMEMRATGSVWRLDLRSNVATCIADGLAFPNGVLIDGGRATVSESWSHRILRFDAAGGRGRPEVVLEDLPGYPGRLAPAADGGAWLAVFAPRSQLIEFVLRERAYCARMLREIPRSQWIAPTLRAGRSFKEPMQGGAVKVHGIFKPWAPTRSYGLLVKLDGDLAPVASFHSRADGRRHGIVSACEWGGAVVFASRGDDLVGALAMPPSREPLR
jgi:hypothetical protein